MWVLAGNCSICITTVDTEAAPGVEFKEVVLVQSHRKGDIERVFGIGAVRVVEKSNRSFSFFTVVPKTKAMAAIASLLIEQEPGDLLSTTEETGGRRRAYEEVHETMRRHGAGMCDAISFCQVERDANTIDMFDAA